MSFFLGGDFRFFWPENIGNFVHLPSAWDNILNTGIGQSQLGSLWITSYLNFTAFFSKLGLSWDWISVLFWIFPAIILSFFSSFSLFNYLFSRETGSRFAGKDKVKYSLLAGIIYTFNTYFLMILTGGQLGVALSYSLVPLVLLTFIRITKNPTLKNALLSGLVLGSQLLFDPRVVYVTLIAVFTYLVFDFQKIKAIKNKYLLIVPFGVTVLLNSFWILSLILTKNSPLPMGFDSASGFKFFSFADFSHSVSLLHPNWPENIFGKIYFLNPEFLILPIIAYSSLLFISKIKDQRSKIQIKNQKFDNNVAIEQFNNRAIIFFALLGLLGAFLAKGANAPLGFVNEFLFQHLPGMAMFRDPTKWYLLIALSYSILIPYALKEISKYFKFAIILFVLYLIYLINPIFGQIKIHQVPQGYVQLKNFLDDQRKFSRTLWIPQWQRFGYFSNNHPAIGREEIFKGNSKNQAQQLKESGVSNLLRDLSVKYIVVPYDSEGEIFLKDRKYNNDIYQKTINEVKQIPYLKQVSGFGKIGVFEVPNPKDHFWSPSENLKINYKFINPTKYELIIKNAKKGDIIIFSESYDKNWIVHNLEFRVHSLEFNNRFNSFILPKSGNYVLEVYYTPQDWVNRGLVISIVSLVGIIAILIGFKLKKW